MKPILPILNEYNESSHKTHGKYYTVTKTSVKSMLRELDINTDKCIVSLIINIVRKLSSYCTTDDVAKEKLKTDFLKKVTSGISALPQLQKKY